MDLSNCATKADLKGATSVDTSKLAVKSEGAVLKPQVGKLDVDKLKALPTDLSKLSNVGSNYVVKKLCMIDWLKKLMSLILRYQILEDYFLKQSMIHISKILKKRLNMFIKRYLIPVG